MEKFTEEIPEKLRKNKRRNEDEISSLTRQLQDVKIEGTSARPAAVERDRIHRDLEPLISGKLALLLVLFLKIYCLVFYQQFPKKTLLEYFLLERKANSLKLGISQNSKTVNTI